jgi:hypothetical protein
MNLSPDGQRLELFFPQIWPLMGFMHPEGIAINRWRYRRNAPAASSAGTRPLGTTSPSADRPS